MACTSIKTGGGMFRKDVKMGALLPSETSPYLYCDRLTAHRKQAS